jgi:hypothetical protein
MEMGLLIFEVNVVLSLVSDRFVFVRMDKPIPQTSGYL